MAILTFQRGDEYPIDFNGVQVFWYFSNLGHWFVRAPDLVKLLGLSKDDAKVVYTTALPEALQTNYLGREQAGLLLTNLRDLSGGESRKLWNEIKSGFYLDAPTDKMEVPVLPYKVGSKIVPAFNVSQLSELGAVSVTAGTGSSFDLMNKTNLIIPCSDLVVNDSQVQHLINAVNALDMDDASAYAKAVKAANKIKLVLTAVNRPTPKAVAQRREIQALEEQNAHLMALLAANGISLDSTATQSVSLQDSALAKIEKTKQDTITAVTKLVTEQYASLMVQSELIKEASSEIAGIYSGWDHAKFVDLFDNQRVLNVVRVVIRQLKDRDMVDLQAIQRLVDENVGKDKPLVKQMIRVAREHYAKKVVPLAAS